MVKTCPFDVVADTLNEIAPFDWRDFLMARLNSTDFHAPLGGIERSGWNLAYQPKLKVLKDYEQVCWYRTKSASDRVFFRSLPACWRKRFRNNSTVTRGTSAASKQIQSEF